MAQKINKTTRSFALVLIMFCLMQAAWRHAIGVYKMHCRKEAFKSAEKELMGLYSSGTNDYFVQQTLNAYAEAFDWQRFQTDLSAIKAEEQILKEAFGAESEFFFFGADSQLIYASPNAIGRFAIKKIYAALLEHERTLKSTLMKANRRYFNAFIGGVSAEDILNEKGSAVKIVSRGVERFFYWNTFVSHDSDELAGGIIANIHAAGLNENLAIKRLIANKNKERPQNLLFGLAQNLSKNHVKIYMPNKNGFNISGRAIAKELRRHAKEHESKSNLGGVLLKTMPFEANKTLFAAVNTLNSPYKAVDFIIETLLIVAFMFAAKHIFMGGKNGVDSLKPDCCLAKSTSCMQSLGLKAALGAFVFVSAVLGFAQYILFNEAQNNESFDKIIDCHNSIDNGYNQALSELEHCYFSLSKQDAAKNIEPKRLKVSCDELAQKNRLSRLYILDKNGAVRFCYRADKVGEDMFIRFLPTAARNIYFAQSMAEKSLKDNISESLLKAFVERYADLIGGESERLFKTLENLNKIGRLDIASQRLYVYSSFIERTGENDKMLMFAFCSANAYAEAYLEGVIKKYQKRGNKNILLAMISKTGNSLPLPRTICKYPFIFRLSEKLKASGTRQTCIGTMSDGQYFVAASSLKQAENYILFGMIKK